jgi:hypothetical protein
MTAEKRPTATEFITALCGCCSDFYSSDSPKNGSVSEEEVAVG